MAAAGAGARARLAALAGRHPPLRALRLGLLLSANPKTLLLAVAGELAIGAAELSLGGSVVAVVVFTAVAVLSVVLPLLLHVHLGARVLSALGRAEDWLAAHSAAVVVAGALVVIGALLAGKGLAGL
ncbi:GAP family protein [Geodermatophilus sp. CPCC 206100]